MWQAIGRTDLGLLGDLDNLLVRVQERDQTRFPTFDPSDSLIIASDYSGEHKQSVLYCYAFLITTHRSVMMWHAECQELRRHSALRKRRMAFKSLRDGVRQRVLPRYLGVAGALHGILVTLLVDKRLESLFEHAANLDMSRPEFAPYAHWRAPSLEKLLRVTHVLGFLVAGMSRPMQDVLWVTDQDEIAANPERLAELTSVFGTVTSHLSPHNLGHLRVATTASDPGDLSLEDLTAIPDLAAGAIAECFCRYDETETTPESALIVPAPTSTSTKSRMVMNWLSDRRKRLHLLTVTLGRDDQGLKYWRHYVLHGSQ